jgi:hypothetical protein
MSNLRDIHQVGWPLVPVLRVQAPYKAKEPEVQGKAKGKGWEYSSFQRSRWYSTYATPDKKIRTKRPLAHLYPIHIGI